MAKIVKEKNMLGLDKFTFNDMLKKAGEIYGEDGIAYIADDKVISRRELRKRVDDMAACLIDCYGVEPGDRISLISDNSHEWLGCFFAIIRAGAVAVVENPLFKGSEISKHYDNFHVKLVIVGKVSEELESDLRSFFGEKVINDKELFYCDYSCEDPKMLDELDESLPERREAVDFFTSGSTSEPKIVMLSQEAILHDADFMAFKEEYKGEHLLITVPLAHILGIVSALRDLIYGVKLLLTENKMDKIVDACKKYDVRLFLNVPMMIKMLTLHPEFETAIKPKIDYLVAGSAAITPEEAAAIEEKYDALLICGYGMTEASGVVTMPSFNDTPEKRYTTLGEPIGDIEVRIQSVTEEGEEVRFCKSGELGEVLVKGDVLMNGYAVGNDSDEIIDESGYLHTGDIGYLDEDGFLHLSGRKKNIIIKGGEKILPGEVERCIADLNSVRAVTVIGVPDDKYGEEIAALVIPRDGCSVTLEDAQKAVSKHCTRFKQPKYLLLYDEFPLTMVGKTDLISLKNDAIARIESA